MAVKTFAVKDYEVGRASRLTLSGGDLKFYTYIICRSQDEYRFILYFFLPDDGQVHNRFNPSAKVATAYLPSNQFKWYIRMLKNNKPIYAYLNSDKPIINHLYIGTHLGGEEERYNNKRGRITV